MTTDTHRASRGALTPNGRTTMKKTITDEMFAEAAAAVVEHYGDCIPVWEVRQTAAELLDVDADAVSRADMIRMRRAFSDAMDLL